MDLDKIYNDRYKTELVPACGQLDDIIRDHLDTIEHVDSISVRAKSPDRFLAKATKLLENGKEKYPNPLGQIQDQIGARIVVFYKSDVEIVSEILGSYFRPIEAQTLEPDSLDAFGYMGRHFVFSLPVDIAMPENGCQLFELQVKTLFQHAWAEASHDIAYKQLSRKLANSERRLIAFAAAQAWGADNAFSEISEEISRSKE